MSKKPSSSPKRDNAPVSLPAMPPMPPPSPEKQAQSERMLGEMKELIALATQRNLECAAKLAQLALYGRLPLELQKHFGELGRRYAHLTELGARRPKPALRVVDGGAA